MISIYCKRDLKIHGMSLLLLQFLSGIKYFFTLLILIMCYSFIKKVKIIYIHCL